jgi:hypothetical protein
MIGISSLPEKEGGNRREMEWHKGVGDDEVNEEIKRFTRRRIGMTERGI